MKKEKNELKATICISVFLVLCGLSAICSLIFLFTIPVGIYIITVFVIPFILISAILCPKEYGLLFKEFYKKMESLFIKEKKKNKVDQAEMIKKLYSNAPVALNQNQKNALMNLRIKIDKALHKYGVQSWRYVAPLDDTQIYTALFINNAELDISITKFTGEKRSGYVNKTGLLGTNMTPADIENVIPMTPVKKERKVSKKVIAERKKRKQSVNPDVIIKNGKEYQAPNYSFIAKEWVTNNMGLLNKMVMDSEKKNGKITVTINKDRLPIEKECWKLIGKQLKDDDEIDRYIVEEDALKIIIN